MTARFFWFMAGWSIMVPLVFGPLGTNSWWFFVGMGFAGVCLWNGLISDD